jgi:hypothetical protein
MITRLAYLEQRLEVLRALESTLLEIANLSATAIADSSPIAFTFSQPGVFSLMESTAKGRAVKPSDPLSMITPAGIKRKLPARKLSAKGIRNIKLAQRHRWAKWRATKAKAQKARK